MNTFLWKSNDEGTPSILHAYLLPSRLATDGITINCESNYPFTPCALHYSIETDKAFEFLLRIPTWASTSSTIELKGLGSSSTSIVHSFAPNTETQPDSLHSVKVPRAGSFEIFVTINAEVRVKQHENNSVSFYYGPLLYAFEIDFDTKTRLPRNYKDQASDCAEIAELGDRGGEPWMQLTRDHDYLPKSDWNIAVDPTKEVKVVVSKEPWSDNGSGERTVAGLPDPVWGSGASPAHLEVTAAWVNWPTRNGTAADPRDVERKIQGDFFVANLVPYGTAKLHVAQFPVVDVDV